MRFIPPQIVLAHEMHKVPRALGSICECCLDCEEEPGKGDLRLCNEEGCIWRAETGRDAERGDGAGFEPTDGAT
jgi:hypothetical protein